MTPTQKKILNRLKAIENKAWTSAVRDCSSTADALVKYGEDRAYLAWIDAADTVRSFATPYGGRR